MKQNSRVKRVGRQAVTWLPIILAPLLLALIVSGYSYALLEHDAVRRNRLIMEQMTQKLESLVSDVESYAVSLSANMTLRQYVSKLAGGEQDVLSVRRMIEAFPKWNTGNELIDSCYLYVVGTDMMVSGSAAYTRLNTTYDSVFHYGTLDYEAWKQKILLTRSHLRLLPAESCLSGGKKGDRPLLLQSVVNYATGRVEGQILVYLSTDAMGSMMQSALDFGAVHVSVLNGEGPLASVCADQFRAESALLPQTLSDDERFSLNGRRFLSTVVSLKKRNMTFRLVFPMDSISKQVGGLTRVMLLYILLLLLICLAAFIYSALRFRQPYQKAFLRLLPEADGKKPIALEEMERALDGLMSGKRDMEKKLEEQKNLLTASLYYRLIHGGFRDEKQVEQLVGQTDADLYAPGYFGALIETAPDEENGNAHGQLLVSGALSRLPDRIAFSAAIDGECVAALFKTAPNEEVDAAVAFFRNFYETLRERGVLTQIYLGMRVDALETCPRSFDAAQHLRDCASADSTKYIVTYDRNVKKDVAYDYTQEDEHFLSARAAAGDLNAVDERLDALEKRNSGDHLLNAFQTRLLLARMTDTLARAARSTAQEEKSREPLEEMLSSAAGAPFSAAFDGLREGYARLCGLYEDKKKSHNALLAAHILDYLRYNYEDENLCLTGVSLHFGLNERYLSAFFKEQTGDSFTNYVQQLRIERANELLKEGTLSIAEIARQVGYASPNTFRNAYKRCVGCTPSIKKKGLET